MGSPGTWLDLVGLESVLIRHIQGVGYDVLEFIAAQIRRIFFDGYSVLVVRTVIFKISSFKLQNACLLVKFHQGYHHPRINLNSLIKQPNEILASELQLNLQPPRLMQLSPKKENQDKYYDYYGEKGHYTNDYFQLRRQLEMALESRKLNHMIKDVRRRGRGNTKGRDTGKDKSINRSGSIDEGDVQALLREPEPRYKVAPKEHSVGFSRFRGWCSETIVKNRIGSGLR
ncbi:hypothetical protein Tco_1174327 [Tanacetum coccineum]